MKFHINIDGIFFDIQIKNYRKSNQQNWDSNWCRVDFSFISESWLNYCSENNEDLLSCEVEELAESIEKLLDNELGETKTIDCIEPDFDFILYPPRDIRNDPQVSYVKEGYEIIDCCMDLKINFWDDGALTANYLSLTFGRKEIELLRNYLYLVLGKLALDSPEISEMVRDSVLL